MKEDYVRRKERWAQKMSGKNRTARPNTGRLPSGQHEVNNFPVLDLGVHPEIPLGKWSLKIHGEVENPLLLNWEQFKALPQFRDVSDFHCVTTWKASPFLPWPNSSSRSQAPLICFSSAATSTPPTLLSMPVWMTM
jgi:DMSO/TMAO reductase YedYZ molybdopterin-dependent catalytic subunit